MKKDLENKGKTRSIKIWLIVFFFMAVFSLVFFDYRPEKAKLFASNYSSFYARIHDYMHEKKTDMDEKIVKVQQIAANEKDKQREIHFEFYTVLPNMRVPVPETDKPVAVIKSPPEINTHSAAIVANLFDPGRLQNDLKEEFVQQLYVVQTGVFKYAAGAEKIHQALLKTGVPVRVVKIRMAKGKAYSVQAGPFTSKDEAKLIQQQLKKKNLNGIIRKL